MYYSAYAMIVLERMGYLYISGGCNHMETFFMVLNVSVSTNEMQDYQIKLKKYA